MLFSEIKEGNGTADTKYTTPHNLQVELKYATNKESTYDYTSYDKDFTILWGKEILTQKTNQNLVLRNHKQLKEDYRKRN